MQHQQMIADLGSLLLRFRQTVLEILPNLVAALGIFLIGLALAFIVRWATRRLVKGLDRLVPGARLQQSLRQVRLQQPAAEVISRLLFWIIILFFATAATETLGLPVVTTWLNGIALYLPRILSAALIVLVGIVGGVLLRDLIQTAAARLTYGETLGRIAQIAILLVSVLVAVDQLGLNIALLTQMLVALLAALFFSAALAFGLGARTAVSNILSSYYLQKTYSLGHMVRIGDIEGEIVEFTPTGVVVANAADRILVPAKMFSEGASALCGGVGQNE